jgi:tetratricopeptide (TPR) repeat protein/cell division protein FtsN
MKTCTTGVKRRCGFPAFILLLVFWGSLAFAATPVQAGENWFEQGLADIKAGRFQAAVDKFTMALEAVPDDFEALNNRGFARIYTGDYDGAVEDCTRSIAINPGSAKAYNNRGLARMSRGDSELALADFDKALAINPRYIDAYSNRCLAWSQKEDYPKAILDGTEALHLNPRSAKALYCRGYARDRQGNPAGALRDHIQALTVNPDFIEALNSIAWILATSPDDRLRDGPRAVVYAEKVVADTPPDINFLDTLAAAYAEAGRFDDAVAVENRIISLLASARQTASVRVHVQRMNQYEQGQPYREPIAIQPVSMVTDLEGELAALDRLVAAPGIRPAVFDPRADTANTSAAAAPSEPSPPVRMAQAQQTTPAPMPEAVSQSIRTSPGIPVEINLASGQANDRQLTYEIETVPYQGALQGTLPYLVYTPRSGFEGVDRFTFRIRSASGPSNLATITIQVAPPPLKTPGEAPPADAAEPTVEEAPSMESTAPPKEEDKPVFTEEIAVDTEGTAPEPSAVPAPPIVEAAPTAEPQPPADSGTPLPPEASPAPPAAAATAAAPQPPGDLPSDAVYTIQVRSLKTADGAAAVVAKLKAEGFAAFSQVVDIPEKGQWHRIYVNGYASKAAARDALGQLDPDRFKGAFIRRLPAGLVPPPASPAPAPEEASPPQAVDTPEAEPAAAADAGPQAIPVSGRYPYAYQIKSFKQKEEAFQLGLELTSQGQKTFIGQGTMGSTGVWYRVYIGCYATPEEAENDRETVAREGFPEAFLTPIGFAVTVKPADDDPNGNTLENRLMASGFLPYRLPAAGATGSSPVLVGGFRHFDDAKQVLAALEQSGFKGEITPR